MSWFQVHVRTKSTVYQQTIFCGCCWPPYGPKGVSGVSCLLLQGMACVGRTKQCTIVPSNHFGPIPGVPVGSMWKFRVQVRVCWLPFWKDEGGGRRVGYSQLAKCTWMSVYVTVSLPPKLP